MPDEQVSPDERPSRQVVRQLTIDVYDDGNWVLNMKPTTSELMKFETLGILSLIVAQLQSPPLTSSTVGLSEGTSDVLPADTDGQRND